MAEISKVNVGGTLYDIKDATARTDLLSKLSDAPSDGEEYVRKNGAWAISSGGSGGGGGGLSAMYYYQQTVSTATNAEIMRITDPRINTNSIVLECTFADPSYITSDVTWTSYAGYMAFTGTCVAATTANVTIGYTSNDNFSDRLMTLVWENPNPTSDFSSQTLSLDFSSYDFILVKTKLQKLNQEYQDYKDTFIIEKNNNFTMVMHLGAQANSLSANKYTKARIVNFTDDSITIGDCYSRQWNTTSGNSGTVTNSDCIPLAIYGISRYNYFEEKNLAMDFICGTTVAASTTYSLTSGYKFSDYEYIIVVAEGYNNEAYAQIPIRRFKSSTYDTHWLGLPDTSGYQLGIRYSDDTHVFVSQKGANISNMYIYGVGRYADFSKRIITKDYSVTTEANSNLSGDFSKYKNIDITSDIALYGRPVSIVVDGNSVSQNSINPVITKFSGNQIYVYSKNAASMIVRVTYIC